MTPPTRDPGSPRPASTPPNPDPAKPRRSRKLTRVILPAISAGVLVILLCLGAAGFGLYRLHKYLTGPNIHSGIADVIDYRASTPDALSQKHTTEPVTYPMTPPAGGPHHPRWQNCMGDIYAAPIANEKAVHSLEHGAVWLTYDPARVDASGVEALKDHIRGVNHTMLSPYPGQPYPVSLQAWGYQLRLETPTDPRIGQFIEAYRITASLEIGAPCFGGSTSE